MHTTNLTRRAALIGAATATVAVAAAADQAIAQPGDACSRLADDEVSPELARLLEKHLQAWDAYGDTCDASDRLSKNYGGPAAEAERDDLGAAEETAMADVVIFPAQRPADRRALAEFIAWIEDECGGVSGYVDAIVKRLNA